MRIATWNVNSLKARMDAVERWLGRAQPDVLLMQETKLSDEDAPHMPFQLAGYELLHHGEGRWNGVAIASRVGIGEPVTNFGDGPVRDSRSGASVAVSEEDFDPSNEARMVSAVCGGIRVASIYAPNGRVVDSPFYEGKLRWFERLRAWAAATATGATPLVIGGDYNVTPADEDVWDAVAAHGGTHVSPRERAALADLRAVGLVDGYRQRESSGGRFSLVGLPSRHVPQEHGHAHRPALREPVDRRTHRVGGDRPRGAQGATDPLRPRARRHRPGRAWSAVRCRLGGSDVTRRRPDPTQASRLSVAEPAPRRRAAAITMSRCPWD